MMDREKSGWRTSPWLLLGLLVLSGALGGGVIWSLADRRPVAMAADLELANHWAVGRKGSNDGIVVLVAPNERKLRIAVGYGLEKILTNAYCKHIIEAVMVPQFKAGSYYDGLMLGVTGLARVARRV